MILIATLGLLAIGTATAIAASPDREDAVVTFAADVYVQDELGQLINPSLATPPAAPLYNIAGTSLERSWGQWSAATATSQASESGPLGKRRTDVTVRMAGLVPSGVYSLFYATFNPDTRHPLCPSAERGLPLTALHPERQRPDASSFVAAATGSATYRARIDGEPLDASRFTLILIYHFDGKTFHPFPNFGEFATQGDDCRSSYGADAMRQLLVIQKSPETL